MGVQAAYRYIAGRMSRVTPIPDPASIQKLMQGTGETRPMYGGFPVMFHKGNRAQNSSLAFSGKPIGLRQIVVSPMRYNQQVTTRRTSKDVRKAMSTQVPSRRKIPGLPAGG